MSQCHSKFFQKVFQVVLPAEYYLPVLKIAHTNPLPSKRIGRQLMKHSTPSKRLAPPLRCVGLWIKSGVPLRFTVCAVQASLTRNTLACRTTSAKPVRAPNGPQMGDDNRLRMAYKKFAGGWCGISKPRRTKKPGGCQAKKAFVARCSRRGYNLSKGILACRPAQCSGCSRRLYAGTNRRTVRASGRNRNR